MKREEEDEYHSLFALFRQPGWKILQKRWVAEADKINTLLHVKDEKDLYNKQGQLQKLVELTTLEETTTHVYESIVEDD